MSSRVSLTFTDLEIFRCFELKKKKTKEKKSDSPAVTVRAITINNIICSDRNRCLTKAHSNFNRVFKYAFLVLYSDCIINNNDIYVYETAQQNIYSAVLIKCHRNDV